MKKKIVVADDDQAILEVIKIMLEDEGYEVIPVSHGSYFSQLEVSNLPDLILLDIWMSGMDGRDIVKDLLSKKETSSIPIILVSANRDTEQIAKDSGATDFLSKPFDIYDLLALVEKHTVK